MMKRAIKPGILAMLLLSAAQSLGTTPASSSQLYARHKGFMVFLNWHFNEKPPLLVEKYFKKVSKTGPWQLYQGKYGAFEDIRIGACDNRITSVIAKTPALKGGIEPFLKEWLQPTLQGYITGTEDNERQSVFAMNLPDANLNCLTQAKKLLAKAPKAKSAADQVTSDGNSPRQRAKM